MNKYEQAIWNFRVTKPSGHLLDETKLLQELVDLKTKMDSIDFDEIQKGCNYLHNIMYGQATKHLQRLLDMLKEEI